VSVVGTPDFSIELTDYAGREADIRRIREAVFMAEQHVSAADEWDGEDPRWVYALAVTWAGEAIGTARLTPEGRIGRMAVLAPHRGRGVGGALLDRLLQLARERGLPEVFLDAQVVAIPFYERRGFRSHGPVFDDAGIPHRKMSLRLTGK
jgi:predicted GNAT family N-acyltransferase